MVRVMVRFMFSLLIIFLASRVCTEMKPEGLWGPVTKPRTESDYSPFRWQTSFDEFEVGRRTPLIACGLMGVPHQAVQDVGHQVYIRYSEFIPSF